jgi:hypothetical protein
MKGLSNTQLSGIDVELKEAVCDALVNALVERVSGTDERGRTIYGGSPRRGIFVGQLLPRFDVSGALDETTDIRIAAIGMDLVVGADSSAAIRVTPRFSAYVRVIPQWSDLIRGGGQLDFDFKLQKAIQQQIDAAIRADRTTALKAAKLERPEWKGMDEARRAKVRAERAQILADVRVKAYAAFGIKLLSGAPDESAPAEEPVGGKRGRRRGFNRAAGAHFAPHPRWPGPATEPRRSRADTGQVAAARPHASNVRIRQRNGVVRPSRRTRHL